MASSSGITIKIRNGILYYICLDCDQEEFANESDFKDHRAKKHGDEFCEPNSENEYLSPKLYSPARKPKDEILKLMEGLNDEQRSLVMYILKCIKTRTNLPLRIFLNGSAGVGKSYVINTLYQLISHHYDTVSGANPTTIKVLLTALTGKAASNINGMTIHSAFKLLVTGSKNDRMGEKMKKALRKETMDLKFIIIDEISFVSSDLLERVNKKLQDLYPSSSTFGGLSVIFVGDLLQLPPIGGLVFLPSKKSDDNYNEFSALWDDFKYYRLNKVVRQEHIEFIDALNNMACGKMTQDNIDLIKASEVKGGRVAPSNVPHLFRYNSDVNKHNDARITNHEEEEVTVDANDQIISRNIPDEMEKKCLNEIKEKRYQDTRGLPSKLRLKLGIKYVITTNLDVSDGLVNGTIGELKYIVYNQGKPAILFFDFNCGSERKVGMKAISKLSNEERDENSSNDWVPIKMKKERLQILKVSLSREQFPIVPAEAQTIHKAQGQTYDGACVAIAGNSRQMNYVATSRVKSPESLYIQGDFKPTKPPAPNDSTMRFLKELQANRNLKIPFNNLEELKGPVIAHHKVKSFHEAQPHIAKDKWYQGVDLLILSGTKTLKSDECSLPNFSLKHHSECLGNRNSFGLLIFAKTTLNVEIEKKIIRKSKPNNKNPYRSEVIVLKLNESYVITGYKSTATLDSIAVKQIEEAMTFTPGKKLLIGDFDSNWTEKDSLSQLMGKNGLQNKLQHQTAVIFANFNEISSAEYVSFISNYPPIFSKLLPNEESDAQLDID